MAHPGHSGVGPCFLPKPLVTYILLNVSERTWVASLSGGIENFRASGASIPSSSCRLIFFQVHSCYVQDCCRNVVAVDPRNRLLRLSFDGSGEFIVQVFFFHSSSLCARLDNSSGCSDKNFICAQSHARKMPSKKMSSMFRR